MIDSAKMERWFLLPAGVVMDSTTDVQERMTQIRELKFPD